MKSWIRLRMVGQNGEENIWESGARLRIGRQESLEVVITDASVSRQHAEIFSTPRGWRVRDFKSTNGTSINGTRLGLADWPVNLHDIIKCGNITFVVDEIQVAQGFETTQQAQMVVEATAACNWDSALQGLAFDRDRMPRPGEQLVALLRAGHHLVHLESEQELLHSILNDAVAALDAQRGAIALADPLTGKLKLQALASGWAELASRTAFSQSMAQRCFSRGESILCRSVEEDQELLVAQSIAEGTMASVICVLLRTPRKKLGVLHMDRGPLQKQFSKDDLHLADALAANVSAGIECAQLLRQQREMFINTVVTLAQAVELRDDYTGGHTMRVSRYAEVLAERMELDPQDLKWIRLGTPLHDIGKIGISDSILLKPGSLTPEEFTIMKTHTTKGAEILARIPDLAPVIPIARSHHERWDGKGYPDGLAGEDIPLLARVVAVADTYDAMTSDRPYRKGMPAAAAFAEIEKNAGKQFDPHCAATFLSIRDQILPEMCPRTIRESCMTQAQAAMEPCMV